MTDLTADCRGDDAFVAIAVTAVVDVPDVSFRVQFPPLSDGITAIQGSLGPLSAGESATTAVQVLEGRQIVVEVVDDSGNLIGGGEGGLITPECGDPPASATTAPAAVGGNSGELPVTR